MTCNDASPFLKALYVGHDLVGNLYCHRLL